MQLLKINNINGPKKMQDAQFSEENDAFYAILKIKIVSAEIRTSNLWVTERALYH